MAGRGRGEPLAPIWGRDSRRRSAWPSRRGACP